MSFSSFASLKQRAAHMKAQASTPVHADDSEDASKRAKLSESGPNSLFSSPEVGQGPAYAVASSAATVPPVPLLPLYIFSSEEHVKLVLTNRKECLADIFVDCGFVPAADDIKLVLAPILQAHALRLTGTVDAISYDTTSGRWDFTNLVVTSANPFRPPLASASVSAGE